MDNKNMENEPTEHEPLTDTPTLPQEPSPSPAPASNVDAPQLVTPAETAPSASPVVPLADTRRGHGLRKLFTALLALVVIAGALAGGYVYGKHSTAQSTTANTASKVTDVAFTVPKGATVLEQCMPGLGTQYILPKDIPQGPVYNVYQGKVTGIQYMLSATSLGTLNSTIGDLQLYGQKYDHVDVMNMPAHAGFPAPHYEIDIMAISHGAQNKITCGGAHSDMPTMPGMTDKSM